MNRDVKELVGYGEHPIIGDKWGNSVELREHSVQYDPSRIVFPSFKAIGSAN